MAKQLIIAPEKGRTYEPPRTVVIVIECQGVLCGSAIDGNSTEAVTTGTFSFP